MSVSHERHFIHSGEDALTGVAELLKQEKILKNLKAALGIIEWDKNAIEREGVRLDTVGTFISPSAKLYEIARIKGADKYAVWEYGLNTLNDKGRPIPPSMQEYQADQSSQDGVTRLSLDQPGADITIDAYNLGIIHVEGSSVPAQEASQMLKQHGVTALG